MMATTPGWADHAAPRGPSAQATLLPAPVTGSAYKGEPQRDGGNGRRTNQGMGMGARSGGVEGQSNRRSKSRSGCLKDSSESGATPLLILCVYGS